MLEQLHSLVDDLYHVDGKAEIEHGEIVRISPASAEHGDVAGEIFYSLKRHQKEHGGGVAYGDNVGFLVDLPDRQSFSPDAAWVYATRRQRTKKFWSGAPAFAVEVRSPEDREPAGQKALAKKIADYFAAGTLVVWDVDVEDEDVIRCYRAAAPLQPQIFRAGEIASAEPAVPGWTLAVDELFP
jgi:Uma2 family endonuclease